MRYFSLPGIATATSAICLGTGGHGSAYSQEHSFALLDAFAGLGGTFLDTAHVYADWIPGGSGASERTVGAWLESRGVRDRFVVGTKGGHPKLETMQVSRLRPEEIAADLDESLQRLRLNTVDLYWLHRDDPDIPVGEILTTLNRFLDQGRIRAMGASNWSTSRLAEAARYTDRNGLTGFCASQIAWSLAEANEAYNAEMRTLAMDAASLSYYCKSKLPVIPYTSQAGGFFAHPYDPGGSKFRGFLNTLNAVRWERAQTIASRKQVSPNAVAVAYLLNHPCGGSAIVGSRSIEQVEDSCHAADILLSAEDLTYLEGSSQSGSL